MDVVDDVCTQPAGGDGSPRPVVFRMTDYSILGSSVAFLLLMGAPLLITILILTLFVLLPPCSAAASAFGLLLLLVVTPVNDKSKLGEKLSRYMCRNICGYFPMTLHVEDINAFDPEQSYVFGLEPHSVMPFGLYALSSYMLLLPLKKVKFLGSSALLSLPILRQIWTWMGFFPGTREIFCSYLTAGYSCIVSPGGHEEMLYMEKHNEVAFIKSRKGFIRIAMELGRPLVPVVCFGQTNVYKWWIPNVKIARKITRIFKFTPIIYWGRFWSPIPFQQPIHIVVGRPIVLKATPQPTMDEINKVHMQFIMDLHQLFDKHKAQAGYSNLQLRIL